MDVSKSPRRFSDREVSLILKRATELQSSGRAATARDGLTLSELQEIALEAGIDPTVLRTAAAELEAGANDGAWAKVAGGPIVLMMERLVSGTLPRDSLDALVPIIVSAADAPGQASAVGETLTWSSNAHGNTRSLQVLVSAEGDNTLVRVEERLGGLAGGLFGGIMGGVGGGAGLGMGGALGGVLGSALVGILIPTVVIAGSYLAARALFKAAVDKRRRALSALVERIVEEIEQHGREARHLSGGEDTPLLES
ncbi:MAG: hypothetical protein ABFS34_09110 [Gemmatimonadota bacterium]